MREVIKKIFFECGFKQDGQGSRILTYNDNVYIFLSTYGQEAAIYFYHYSRAGELSFEEFFNLLSDESKEKLIYHFDFFLKS